MKQKLLNLKMYLIHHFLNLNNILKNKEYYNIIYYQWEIYANTCRDIMSKALGIKTLNAGYRDGMEY